MKKILFSFCLILTFLSCSTAQNSKIKTDPTPTTKLYTWENSQWKYIWVSQMDSFTLESAKRLYVRYGQVTNPLAATGNSTLKRSLVYVSSTGDWQGVDSLGRATTFAKASDLSQYLTTTVAANTYAKKDSAGVSIQNGNSLRRGSDGKLYVPTPSATDLTNYYNKTQVDNGFAVKDSSKVSLDNNNQILRGSDGGLFVEQPNIVVGSQNFQDSITLALRAERGEFDLWLSGLADNGEVYNGEGVINGILDAYKNKGLCVGKFDLSTGNSFILIGYGDNLEQKLNDDWDLNYKNKIIASYNNTDNFIYFYYFKTLPNGAKGVSFLTKHRKLKLNFDELTGSATGGTMVMMADPAYFDDVLNLPNHQMRGYQSRCPEFSLEGYSLDQNSDFSTSHNKMLYLWSGGYEWYTYIHPQIELNPTYYVPANIVRTRMFQYIKEEILGWFQKYSIQQPSNVFPEIVSIIRYNYNADGSNNVQNPATNLEFLKNVIINSDKDFKEFFNDFTYVARKVFASKDYGINVGNGDTQNKFNRQLDLIDVNGVNAVTINAYQQTVIEEYEKNFLTDRNAYFALKMFLNDWFDGLQTNNLEKRRQIFNLHNSYDKSAKLMEIGSWFDNYMQYDNLFKF